MNNSNIYIGIDAGVNGAIVIRYADGIGAHPMPTVKASNGKSNPLPKAIWAHLSTQPKPALITIEDPGAHAPSAAGLRSMTAYYWACRTIAEMMMVPTFYPLAKQWQKEFWGATDDTKASASDTVRKLDPLFFEHCEETFNKKQREGIYDAYLICEYGRRKNG